MTENKKLRYVKGTAKFAVSVSVTFVVAKAIKTYVPVENDLQKAKLYVGAYTLSHMAAEKASDYIGGRIDRGVETFLEVKAKIEETSK